MTRSIIVATLALVAVYGLIEAWPLIAGPSLAIVSPVDNGTYPDGIVQIQGRARNAAQLLLNGAPLSRDQEGYFSSTLTFPRGGSILTFVATDRFGETASATRSIFVP